MQGRHQAQARADKPHGDADQDAGQLVEDPMSEQNRQVLVLNTVVAANTLYPRDDFLVADPQGREHRGKEGYVGEAFFHEISSEFQMRFGGHLDGCSSVAALGSIRNNRPLPLA